MVLLLELRGGLLAPAPIKGAVSRACVRIRERLGILGKPRACLAYAKLQT
jgi:hypothetical protein